MAVVISSVAKITFVVIEIIFLLADTSVLVTKITFVEAEILFKEAVITTSVVKIIYLVGEITFSVAVMTLWQSYVCMWPGSPLWWLR